MKRKTGQEQYTKEIPMPFKHIETCPALLIIKELKIITTVAYHSFIRWTNIKKFSNMHWIDEDGKKRLPYFAAGSINWYNFRKENLAVFN